MKVNCNKCQSSFNIDPNRIPPKGLTIRCPKCLNPFFVPGVATVQQTVSSNAETRSIAVLAEEPHATTQPKTEPQGESSHSGLIDMLLGADLKMPAESAADLPPLPDIPELPKLPEVPEPAPVKKSEPPPAPKPPGEKEQPREPDRQFAAETRQVSVSAPAEAPAKTAEAPAKTAEAPATTKEVAKDRDKGSGLEYGMFDIPGLESAPAAQEESIASTEPTRAMESEHERAQPPPQPKETLPVSGGRMKIRRRSGKVFGPFYKDTIIRMIVEHKLLGNEETSEDGNEWIPIGQVQEFSAAIKHIMDQAGPEAPVLRSGVPKAAPAATRKGIKPFDRISKLPVWILPTIGGALVLAACFLPLALDQGVFGYRYFARLFQGGVTGQERELQNSAAAALENDVYGEMNRAAGSLKAMMKSSRDKDRTGGLLARTWLLFLQRYGLEQAQAAELKKLIEELEDLNSSQPDALLARTVYYSLGGAGEARAQTRGKLDAYPDYAAYTDAVLAFSDKDSARAEKLVEAFLKYKPKNILALHLMGVLALGKGDKQTAAEYFKKALDLNGAHLTSKAELDGISLMSGGDRDEVINDLRSIIASGKDLHPKEIARARYLLGLAYMSKKMAPEAEDQLSQAVKQDPENNLYRNAVGLLHLENMDIDKAQADFTAVITRNPQDVTASLGFIRVLIEKRNIMDALSQVTKLAGFAGNNPEVLFYKGRVEEELEKYNDAIATFRSALGIRKDYLPPRLEIAKLLIREGKDKEAMAELDEAMKASPGSKEVHNSRGEVLSRIGKLDDAIKEFEGAVAADKYFTDARFNLAVAQVGRGDCQDAIKNLEILLSQVGKYPMGRYWLGRACMCIKDYNCSVAAFEEAMKASTNDPVVLAMAGRAYSEKGEYPRAIELLQSALVYDRSMAEAYYQLGMTYRRTRESEKAIEDFRQAVSRDRKNAQYRFMLGQALIRGGLLSEAVDELKASSELEPDWAKTYYQLGRAYRLQRQCKMAIPAFQKAYSLDSKRVKALYMVARCQVETDDLRGAEKTLLGIVRSVPDFSKAHYLLGRVYMKTGRTDGAFAQFNKVVKLDSKNPMPHYYLGFMYKEKNKSNEAAYHFNQYLKIAPNGPYAKDLRDELDFIKQNSELSTGKGGKVLE